MGGTGLGLAIAKRDAWRPHLVESSRSEGATFQMELPILAENRKAMA